MNSKEPRSFVLVKAYWGWLDGAGLESKQQQEYWVADTSRNLGALFWLSLNFWIFARNSNWLKGKASNNDNDDPC